MFFIGRNIDYAAAMEGSLKLKEISYIHSEAYAAGELKHGTIALIDEKRLVVALCCQTALFEKMVSNIQEVKARGAKVLGRGPGGRQAHLRRGGRRALRPEGRAALRRRAGDSARCSSSPTTSRARTAAT